MLDIISVLEKEVADAANQMTVEVVLLLIDKWEREIRSSIRLNKIKLPDLLNHYIRLKISLHHVRKAWDRGWSGMDEQQFAAKDMHLRILVSEARRNYYVAKQRFESDKHGDQCSCRGCRCIEGIDW